MREYLPNRRPYSEAGHPVGGLRTNGRTMRRFNTDDLIGPPHFRGLHQKGALNRGGMPPMKQYRQASAHRAGRYASRTP
jgi:hypothetical protein